MKKQEILNKIFKKLLYPQAIYAFIKSSYFKSSFYYYERESFLQNIKNYKKTS